MKRVGWVCVIALAMPVSARAQEVTVEEPLQVVVLPEATPRPKPLPRKKPIPQLVCGPATGSKTQIGVAGLDGFTVHCRVRVMFPDERFWCPEVEWEVNGERQSMHHADCAPFDDVATEVGEPFLWNEPEKWLPPFGRGFHTIKVRLKKGGKVLFSDICEVEVS
ncbi:MAG TPA: hypothetical protein VJ553_02720 [Candidatus Paceibacterota bacterium]|nr:hypothetical protein [Candidatus Paceibacterota bacterium]